jgi:glycogen phosphorylase
MKAAMRDHAGVFNTNRMVREYTDLCYVPSAGRVRLLREDGLAGAKALAAWKAKIYQQWSQLRIEKVSMEGPEDQELKVGNQLQVQAQVHLGSLNPTDVAVQLFYGKLNAEGLIVKGNAIPMLIAQSKGKGKYIFAGAITCTTSGRHGYALRIIPHHEDMGSPFEMGLILWGG